MRSKLWTAERLADFLQVGVETVWRYTREGKLPAVKIGNHYRYPVDEVLAALRHVGKRSTGAGGANDAASDRVAGERRMTLEEFNALPEQPGLQLIDGLVVKEPSPRYGHQAVVGQLFLRMATYVNERRIGRVILAPFDVVLANHQVLQPDIMFVSNQRLHLLRENGLFGAPDLVVEVLSASSRLYDEGRKRELYFEHGCLEMWIVDPDDLTVVLSVRGETGWEDRHLTRQDVIVSPTLGDFQLGVGSLVW